jgi:hypothetical protein
MIKKQLLPLAAAFFTTSVFAHYVPDNEYAITNTTPLRIVIETKGPVRAPAPTKPSPDLKVSGQGFWKFVAARDLVPVPAAVPSVKQAHGTIIVDKQTDTVYWGLQGVGWIGFSNKLHNSWIVAGNAAFTNGNLHGADIFPRGKKSPRIAAADNMSGKIYLTDASFQNVETLVKPDFGSYATNKGFAPTDVAFTGGKEMWVVDGYAQQRIIPADVIALKWRGEHYGGGERFSKTTHGITYDKAHDDLLISARPEGLLKRVDRNDRLLTEILGLPKGTWLCDVDVWGDYALAACLNGVDKEKTPGPLYIINLKKRVIVAAIKPKEELGYEDAQHMHDAAWYVTGKGRNQEVYILFTNWNPGGIGALKLVNIEE